MELWYPPKDRPHLFEWWRPLILASAKARRDRFPWPVHLDEMVLVGRIDRSSRPAIWVYRHPEARGELYVDATGQAYKFTKTAKGKALGRFTACEIRTALWRAGLPEVVEPIWYDTPPPPPVTWTGSTADPDPALDPDPDPDLGPAEPVSDGPPEPRRRGHLIVHDGGRPLAG